MFASRFFEPRFFVKKYFPDIAANIVISYTPPNYPTTQKRGVIRITGFYQ